MGVRPLEIFLLLQCGDKLQSSESDVYRRQILTTKVYPRAVRVNGSHPDMIFNLFFFHSIICRINSFLLIFSSSLNQMQRIFSIKSQHPDTNVFDVSQLVKYRNAL